MVMACYRLDLVERGMIMNSYQSFTEPIVKLMVDFACQHEPMGSVWGGKLHQFTYWELPMLPVRFTLVFGIPVTLWGGRNGN